MPERYLTEKERLQRDVKIRDRKIALLQQRLEYAKQDVRRAELKTEAASSILTALVEASGGKAEISVNRLKEIAVGKINAYVKIDPETDKYILTMSPEEDAEDSAENA